MGAMPECDSCGSLLELVKDQYGIFLCCDCGVSIYPDENLPETWT